MQTLAFAEVFKKPQKSSNTIYSNIQKLITSKGKQLNYTFTVVFMIILPTVQLEELMFDNIYVGFQTPMK